MDVLDEDTLVSKCWWFGRPDGATIAPQLRLLPGGRIGLHHHDNEASWSLVDGVLRFHDNEGRVSTRFSRGEGWQFEGPFVRDEAFVHALRAVERVERWPGADEIVVPLDRGTGGRRNLVVLRAGRGSLHPRWVREDAERSWDLCISWYDHGCALGVDPDADFEAMQAADRKFPALWKLFGVGSPFWRYDHVMFPDDDLMMSWHDIDRMFDVMRHHDLLLAQPGLFADSHVLHDLTRKRDEGVLRFTNFVEVMVPVFSRAALRACAPTFGMSASAFGLDHVWPRLLGLPPTRIAIVDAVGVAHTRPMGGAYDIDAANAEGARVRGLFGIGEHFDERGRLFW
jgi:hypothetical protein